MGENGSAFDVVVVGAGPAGLAAACAAAESGRRVALADETPWLGGQIWRGHPGTSDLPRGQAEPGDSSTDGVWTSSGPLTPALSPSEGEREPERRRCPSLSPSEGEREGVRGPLEGQTPPRGAQAQRWLARFLSSGARLLAGSTVIAVPEPGLLLAERDGIPCQIRWQRLVLATGARELFLPFPGWTLPGILGPGGFEVLVKNGWPVQGQRVLIAGSGPLLLAAAADLRRHGARIVGICEQAPRSKVLNFGLGLWRHPGKLWQASTLKLGLAGVPYHCGAWPLRAEGDGQVRTVTFTNGKKTWQEACDSFACGFGLVPNVELPLALGCEVTDGFVRVDTWQATSMRDVYCAGELTGIGGADCALAEGLIAGYAAAGQAAQAERLLRRRASWHRFRTALAHAFALRPELKSLATDETIVCRCEDVTLGQMRRFSSWREAKLQCRSGMGACQGRTCGAAAKVLLGWEMESVRPPVLPALVRSLISDNSCTQHSKDSQSWAMAGRTGLNETARR